MHSNSFITYKHKSWWGVVVFVTVKTNCRGYSNFRLLVSATGLLLCIMELCLRYVTLKYNPTKASKNLW